MQEETPLQVSSETQPVFLVGVAGFHLLAPEAHCIADEILAHSGRILFGLPAMNLDSDILLPGETRTESISDSQDLYIAPSSRKLPSTDINTKRLHENVINGYCPRCLQLKTYIDANFRLDRDVNGNGGSDGSYR